MSATIRRHLLVSFALACAAAALWPSAAAAQVPGPVGTGAIVNNSGCYANNLGRNDDSGSGSFPLGFTVNWFGTNRSMVNVNNNGGIALDGTTFSQYSGVDIRTFDRPIIVAAFADLDTRNSSTSPVTWGPLSGTWEGRSGYCINWANIGYYNQTGPALSAQVLILNRSDRRAGDFDIVMNYNWVTGSRALEVGFTSGTAGSNWYRFSGSGVAGAFADSTTATALTRYNSVPAEYSAASRSQLGRYVFQSVNGSVNVASGPGSPSAPTNVTATAGAGQATVSWTAPSAPGASAITDYIIDFSANNGSSWSTFADGTSTATSTTVTGLTNGTTYVFRVTARNTQGNGAASAPSAAVTPATVPGAPASLVATPGNGTASIAFTAGSANGSAITNHQYQLNGGSWTALSPAAPGSPITIPGLANGTAYQIRLRAVNAMGAGTESPAVSVTPRTTPAAPTSLTGAGGNGSITVTFTAGFDGGAAISNYRYQLNGGAWTALSPADATSPVTIPGLANGATYAVRLRAVNAAGDGAESGSISVVAQGTPAAPATVTPTPGNTQVALSWAAADGNGAVITDYVIQSSANNGASWATFADGTSTATSATVTGLTNGTAYLFRVAGVNAQGTGAYATSSSATPRTVPDAPTAVTPGMPGSTTVPLSWTAPAGNGGSAITDYVVEYAPGPGFSSWTTFADGTSTTASTTVTGLTNGTAYRFRVSAVNTAGTGSAATSADAATPRTTATAPQSVAVTPGNGQLAVTWLAPASDGGAAITGYTATATAGATTRTCAWTTGAFTCTITGLANGTAYSVTVTAQNAAGTGAASAGVSSTPRTVPDAVGALALTPGDGQVALTWSAPGNGGNAISDYRVQFSSNGGIGWSAFADGASTTAAATVTGLDNGTAYVFRVAAVNAAGDGAFSAASAASTPRTSPGAPTAVAATAGNSEAVISWTAPASNGGVALTTYTATAAPGGRTCTATAPTATCTITGLTNGTTYAVTVRVANAGGLESAASAAASATPRTVPSQVGTVTPTPQSTAVQLAWPAPATGGAAITDYVITYRQGSTGGWTTFGDPVSSATSATVTGLANGTAYEFRVAAVNPAGTGDASAAASAAPRTVPDAPTALATTPGDRQVALTWSAPADNGGSAISDYQVEFSTGSGWTAFADGTSTATSATVTGLTNGTNYAFRVRAVNAAGAGAHSAASAAVAPYQAPGAPRTVTATAGDGQVQLSWAPPTSTGGSAITDYVIRHSTNGGASWTTFADGTSTATAATVTGLTNGTAYRFEVAAVNARGAGAYATSRGDDAAYTALAPGAYVDPAGGWVLIGYAQSGDLGGLLTSARGTYDAATRTGSASVSALPIVRASTEMALTWNQTGLPTGGVGSYAHGVAFDLPSAATMTLDGTNADPSTMTAVTIRELGQATGLAATQYVNATTLGANYGSSYGLTNDRVNWGPDGQGRQAVYLAHGGNTGNQYPRAYVTSNGTGAGYVPSTMALWVRGAMTATPRTTPSAPAAPTLSTVGDGSLAVAWNAPADGGAAITDYVIERAAYDGSACGSYTVFADGTATTTSTTVTGLANGSRYCLRVRAVNAAGTGAASPALVDAVPYTAPAAPAITAAPANGSAQITVTDGATNGSAITGYAYSTDNGATYTALSPASSASPFTIPSLANGTAYTVRVKAINAAGQGAASNAVVVTPRTVPGAPTQVTATAGITSARVTWTAPASTGGAPITGYTVDATVGGSVVNSLSTAQTSATFPSLTAGSPVTFTVYAVNAAGSGAVAGPTGAVTPYAVPAAPTAVTTGVVGDGSVALTWTAGAANGAAITDYVVEYSTDGTTWTAYADGTSATAATTVRGLTNGATYTFRVKAVNLAGTGAASDPSGSATPYTTPGTPTVVVTASSETATSAGFTITAPASSGGSTITDYQYSVDGGTWTSTTGSATFTTSGLTAGRAYAVRVRAVNAAGSGTASAPATATTRPGAPSVVAIVAGNQAVSADVAAAAGNQVALTDWEYEYRVDPSGGWTAFSDTVSTASTVTITGLTNGTAYAVRARARNASGWGAWGDASTPATPVEVGVRVPTGAAAGTTLPMGQWSLVRDTLGSSVRLVDFPGDGSGIVQAVVTTTGADAYLKLGTTSNLDVPTGYASADWTSGSATMISFEGTLANVNAALRTLSVKPTAASGADEITVNVHGVIGNQAYLAVSGGAGIQSGRFYEAKSVRLDARDARCRAKWGDGSAYDSNASDDKCSQRTARRTLYGLDGYLANVTSQVENDFLVKVAGSDAASNPPRRFWIGGSDAASEGTWKWLDGPDAGQTFWLPSCGTGTQGVCSGVGFSWWAGTSSSGEPNNSNDEDYVEFAFNGDRTWNDAATSGADYYLIEYGGEAGDVGIQQAVSSFTVQASQRPVNTGLPTAAAAAVPARTQTTAAVGSWTGLDTSRNGTYFRGNATSDASTTASTDVPGPWTTRSRLFTSSQRDVVAVLDQNGLDLSASSDPAQQTFTFETWVKRPAGGSGMLLNKEEAFELAIMTADGELSFAIMSTAGGWEWIDTDVLIPADTWTHVAYVKNGRTVTIYLNGLQAFQAANSGFKHRAGTGAESIVVTIPGQVLNTTNTLTLGGRSSGCQSPAGTARLDLLPTGCVAGSGYVQQLDGRLSDARLWTTARTQAQIQANMQRRIASDILTWNLDETSGTIAVNTALYGYQWQMAAEEDGRYVNVAGADAQSFTPTTADVGRWLRVRVAASNSAGVTSAFSVPRQITAGAPTAPANVAATSSGTAMTVTWSPPADDGGAAITSYAVTGSPSGSCTATAPATTCTVTGLTPATAYTFTVTATNGAGTGAASSPSASTYSTLTAPTGLTATRGNGSLALAWTAPADPSASLSDYRIRYSSNGGTDWTTWAHAPSTATSATIPGLANGTEYTVEVAAVNVAGAGAVVTATGTPATIPAAPTLDQYSDAAGGGTLRVTPGATGGTAITNYEYSVDGGATWTAISPATTGTLAGGGSVDIAVPGSGNPAFTNGTAYTVLLRAVNAVGSGPATAAATIRPRTTPGAPTEVTATAGAGSATVSFSAPASDGGAEISNYTVTADPGGATCSPAAGEASCTVSGLTNGTAYTFTVRASNAAGAGTVSTASASVTPRTVPGAPQSLAKSAQPGAVELTWAAPAADGGAAVTDYLIEYRPAAAGSWTRFDEAVGTGTTTTVTGLTDGEAYEFRVAAVNAAGPSAFTSAVGGTPGSRPSAPAVGGVTSGDGSITVSWSALLAAQSGGSAVTGYEYTLDNGATWTAIPSSAGLTSHTITGLTNGVPYSVQVRAVNATGEGTASASATTIPLSRAAAPTGLSATPLDGAVEVAFTAGDLGGNSISNYEYSTDDGATWRALSPADAISPVIIATESGDGTTALVNGTAYQVRVRAVTDAPGGLQPATASAAVAATPIGPPTAPASITPVAQAGAVDVGWDLPANAGGSPITDYVLEYSVNDGRNWTTVADGVGTTRAFTVTGLANGTATLFRVAAVTSAGTGPWLTSTAATPRTSPDAPTAVTATPGDGEATVSWTAPASDGGVPVTGYTVTAWSPSSSASGTCSPASPATGTSCSVTGLANGTAYTFTVTATNQAGLDSAASTASDAVVPRTLPSVPRDLAVTPANGALALTWAAPASDGGLAIVRYEFSTNGGADWTAIPNSASATSYTVGGLANGTAYAVQLRAVTSFGTGSATASVSGTPRTVPDAPVIGTPTPADGGATVAWIAPGWDGGDAIVGYDVEISSDNGISWAAVSPTAETGVRLTRTGATATTVSVLGLDNGTPYVFRATARNAAGAGAASAASATVTPRAVPGAPAIATAVPGPARVDLTWTAPASDGGDAIADYRVSYRAVGSGSWTALTETAGSEPHLTRTSATVGAATVLGLQNGTGYEFRVEAANAAGFGAPSAVSDGVTPRTVPDAPTGLTAAPGDGQVVLAFTPGATGGAPLANYEYSIDQGSSFIAFAPATTGTEVTGGRRTLTIANLDNGTSYTFRIRAVNAAGAGAATADVATTPRRAPDQPTQIGGAPGPNSATITFTAGPDGGDPVSNYEYTTDGGQTWTALSPADAASPVTVTGLENGSTYTIGLRAVNAAGAGAASAETAIVRPRTTPSAPTGITTESLAGAIRVYFTPGAAGGAPIENYEHAYQTSTDGQTWSGWSAWTALSPADDLSPIRVNGLVNGTKYRFRVRAVNEAGAGAASSEQEAIDAVVSPEAIPAALTLLTVTAADRSAVVRFQDDFATGQTPSRVQFSIDGGASWREFSTATTGAQVAGATPAQREVTIGGLVNGTTYQVMLRGVNNAGQGPDSNAIAVTPVAPPDPPIEVTPVEDSQRIQLTVVPGDNGGNPITDVQYSLDNGQTFQSTGSSREDFEVTGLENGVTYMVRTRLVNGVGPSAPSNVVAVTPRTVPDPPTNLEATQLDRAALVEWEAPIWDGGAVITAYTVTAQPGGETCAWSSGETRCTVRNLDNGTAYTFTVTATNEAGEGAASRASAPATPRTVPDAPTGLTAAVASGAVDLAWAAPAWNGGAAITRYTVTANPGGQTCTWTAGPLACQMRGLLNGTQYTFTVTAANEAGEGAASAPTAPLLLAGIPVGKVVVPDVAPPVSAQGEARIGLICTNTAGSCTATATLIVAGREVQVERTALAAGQTKVVELPLPRDLQRRLAREGEMEVTVKYVIEEDGKRITREITYTIEAPPAERAANWRTRPATDGSSTMTASCVGTDVQRCEGEVTLYASAEQVRTTRAQRRIVVGKRTIAGPAGEPLSVRVELNTAGKRMLREKGAVRIQPEVAFGETTKTTAVRSYVVVGISEREWLRRALAILYTGGRPRADLNIVVGAAKNGQMQPAAAARVIETEILPARKKARARVDKLPLPPSRLMPIVGALEQSFNWSIRANGHYINWLRTGDTTSERQSWTTSARATAAKERLIALLGKAGKRHGIAVPPATRLWP